MSDNNKGKNVVDADLISADVSELLAVNNDAPADPSNVQPENPFAVDQNTLDEIAAIQEAIAGNDQNIDEIETAAGEVSSDGGVSSAVDFARSGEEEIASTNFETQSLIATTTQSVEVTNPDSLVSTVNIDPTLSVDSR
ncbi:hypothetical protein CXF72_00005, partial [Psychromonas sp. MB-3u-54]|uniref:hypothetical protein n=1 Tax=Psychromonas sp. MB-3u-54 TaxID=2058319 RepID=UPI000CA9F722